MFSICLIFSQFQRGVAYKSVAYKNKGLYIHMVVEIKLRVPYESEMQIKIQI